VTANATTSPAAAGQSVTAAGQARDRLLAAAEHKMREFISSERFRWSSVTPQAGALVDAVSVIVNAGGKRLRPAFCLSGYLAAGGDPGDPCIIPAAVALELLHVCALIHDDVIDESSLRRGVQTVHAWHTDDHRRHHWRGDSRRYGESVAILAGDLALVYADRFMNDAPATVDAAWGELRSELIIGQHLDVAAAAEGAADPELARWIALVKSGRYTIHRPLVLGASIAGRPDLGPAFEAYGAAVGEAFQLRDDLLNVFGSAAATGKPGGLDIEQGKMTLLLTLAIKRDPHLRELVSAPSDDQARLHARLTGAGVREDVEKHIGMLVEQGCEALAQAPMDSEWRDELANMAHQVAYRDR
jgi:geranylgeranyl diphosphate synthase, type I